MTIHTPNNLKAKYRHSARSVAESTSFINGFIPPLILKQVQHKVG